MSQNVGKEEVMECVFRYDEKNVTAKEDTREKGRKWRRRGRMGRTYYRVLVVMAAAQTNSHISIDSWTTSPLIALDGTQGCDAIMKSRTNFPSPTHV